METITIKIKDTRVLKLIYDLEDLNLIQIIGKGLEEAKPKLSDLLAGSISVEEADKMHKELKKMRRG